MTTYLERELNGLGTRKKVLGGLSIIYLKGFLDATLEPRRYSELKTLSPIIYKLGFHKYLSWCLERELITRIQLDPELKEKGTIYQITPKGKTLSELLI